MTFFINTKYIYNEASGPNIKHAQSSTHIDSSNIYIKLNDLHLFNSPLFSFAYHGYEHLDEREMNTVQFSQNIENCLLQMKQIPNVVPFYAHTYGHTKKGNDVILRKYGLTPVYVSGNVNYDNYEVIDRELISNDRILSGKLRIRGHHV